MSKEKIDILKDEVVIPEVVTIAAEDALTIILRETSQEKEQEKMEVALVKNRKPKFKKRWIAIAAVAALAVGTISVGAAKSDDWNWALLQRAGVTEAEAIDTIQLDNGYVMIDASDTSTGTDYLAKEGGVPKDVTLTVTESFGDNNNVYVRIETDYELPEGFEVDKYNYFADFELEVTDVNGVIDPEELLTPTPMEFAGLGGIVEDGKLVFLLEMSGVNLNVCRIDLAINNLYICSDELLLKSEEEMPAFYNALPKEEEGDLRLIYDGSWETSWQFAYEEKGVSYAVDETLDINGIKVHLTEVVLSPIHMTILGEIDKDSVKALVTEAVWNEKLAEAKKEHTEFGFTEEELEDVVVSQILMEHKTYLKTYKICYDDGTYIEPYASWPLDSVWGDELFDANVVMYSGKGIDLENVHSIIVNGGEGATNAKKEILLK